MTPHPHARETTSALARATACTALGAMFLLAICPLAVFASIGASRPGLIDGRDDDQRLSTLAAAGISPSVFVAVLVTSQVIGTVAVFGSAALLVRARHEGRFPTVLAMVLGVWVLCTGPAVFVLDAIAGVGEVFVGALQGVGWVLFYVTFAFFFPDGRAVPRWGTAAAIAFFAWVPAAILLTGTALEWISVVTVIPLFLLCVWAPIHRYRRHANTVQRQQVKWVLWALGLLVPYLATTLTLSVTDAWNGPGGVMASIVLGTVGQLLLALLGVSLAVAVLRLGLYTVDAVIARTLVWGALTGFVIVCFVAIVGIAGAVWPAGTPVAVPVLAAVVAALGANPVRIALQRRVNRWLYGERDDPAHVLARLSDELSATSDLPATISRIATTVQATLRFPSVTVRAIADGETIATAGAPTAAETVSLEIPFESDVVGELTVAPRAGERLRKRDIAVLEDLARSAGIAIHAAIVTERLRRSQAALVDAREWERRRLHRDLHDGLGPTLAGIGQRLELAERALRRDPKRAEAMLDAARVGLSTAIEDVRGIVDTLRPAALDRLGLVEAIRDTWPSGVVVEVDGAFPALPGAVETGAFRIATEAISNSLRHSGADECRVTFFGTADALRLEIVDRGRGSVGAIPHGGLRTMLERAAELGGTLELLEAHPGTRVTAVLPLQWTASGERA